MTNTRTEPRSEIDVVRAALGGDYDVLEELGRGGMAVVYRALERSLGREVAIKVLPAQFSFDEAFVERFQREGRIAAQLEHPNIVPIYRVGRSAQVIYFVMQFLRGQSVSDRLSVTGRIPAAELRRILIETAGALGYAAKRGIVHRDVKPDNIMLDEDGRCVVTDFGIARSAAESKLTATGMSVGTPRYMSPEQARAKPLDGRSDIYSLGIVGYECLVGTTPFDGDDAFAILMKHIKTPVPRPALATDEEWELFEVIERMLAKDPDDRFQSADELIAALRGDAAANSVAAGVTRARLAAPTVPSASGPDDPSGPSSAAALDRALEVGLDLLRQQKPRVQAGLRALKAQQPRVEAGVVAGRTLVEAQAPRARAALGSVANALDVVTVRAAAAAVFLATRTRRFWLATLSAGTLLIVAYYGVHFATSHRSRCPSVAKTPSGADAGASDARPAPFTVLVDAVGSRSSGADLDVYYDVCGLGAGSDYTTRVTVVRNGSGLKRLFGGGVGPVTVSYDETARGPAVRRHRTLALDNMPAGSYSLGVIVTDGAERRRERYVQFQISPR